MVSSPYAAILENTWMLIGARVESASYVTCLNNPPNSRNVEKLENWLYQVPVVATQISGFWGPGRLKHVLMLDSMLIAKIFESKSKMAAIFLRNMFGVGIYFCL